jgi:hypothetical protein
LAFGVLTKCLALRAVYPEHKWEFYTISRPHHKIIRGMASKAQISLSKMVKSLFDGQVVEMNYQLRDRTYPKTMKPIEYDVSFLRKVG